MQDYHQLTDSLQSQIAHLHIENWLNQDLFSWQWWLLVCVLIIPWLVWWRFVEKDRVVEITLLGFITLAISSYLDGVLTELGCWSYHVKILPLWPQLIPADFTVIPVVYMFVYQNYARWRDYIIAMTIIAFLFAFAGESFLVWIDVYQLHTWKHFYSLPIYFSIAVLVKWMVDGLKAKQARRSAANGP